MMIIIQSLGTRVLFRLLSEKRVTSALRSNLRLRYGRSNVRVSCSATYSHGTWRVSVWILGKKEVVLIRKHR